MKNDVKSVDISNQKLVAMRDAQGALTAGASSVLVCENAVVTPSARDFLAQHDIALVAKSRAKSPAVPKGSSASSGSGAYGGASATAPARAASNPRLFSTPEAEAIKQEICAVGRKLWMRQFVDGNGGNISYRIGPNEVICTPTLVSKFDLTPEDMSLVDLEGNQIAGTKPRTSEIFLHLEIYKEVAEAKSVVHCHPPHATAYAITGKVPPNLIVPEFEVFVGKVAISPYKTPGSVEFAQTVLPFVKQHNTVLLANHGIVCWADTVTHAEWLVEILENYCKTYLIAQQIGKPLAFLPDEKIQEILALKRRMGLPDARIAQLEPHE